MPRIVLLALALTLALSTVAAAAPTAATQRERTEVVSASVPPLVKSIRVSGFGRVMATRRNQALYYWTPEKRSPGKIVCTGSCAVAWPVLYVPKGTVVQRRYPGYKGVFGTIRRPNGRLQLTYNRLPLYSYAHEGPNVVRCDDVDGWFVIRLA